MGKPGERYCSTGFRVKCYSGGVLLSHTLASAVPLPCQVLASGFGMCTGRFPWAMTAANL